MSQPQQLQQTTRALAESTSKSPNKKSKIIASKLNKEIIKNVGKDIMKSHVTMSEKSQCIDHIVNTTKPLSSNKNLMKQKQYYQIYRKKQQLQLQLGRVKLQQQQSKQKRPPVLPHNDSNNIDGGSNNSNKKYFRSTTTPQQISKISQILKDKNKFEKQAMLKTTILTQKIEQAKSKQKIHAQQQQKQFIQQKKIESYRSITSIAARKAKREEQIKQRNREYQKLKAQKCAYQQITDNWKIRQASIEQEEERVKQKQRQEHKFDLKDIMMHSRRYSQLIVQQRHKRQTNTKQFKKQLYIKQKEQSYPQTRFLVTLSEQQKERRHRQQQKMMASHIFMNKKTMYAETVRSKFKQKQSRMIAMGGSQKLQPNESTGMKRTQSLDYFGINKLGNDYMKQINACVGVDQLHRSGQAQVSVQPVFKYPDYLSAARNKRQQQNPQNESQQLRQIRKLLKNKQSSLNSPQDRNRRLAQAKFLAERLDQKATDGLYSSKALVESINAKISIIEEFTK